MNPDEYHGGWKTIGVIRDVARGMSGLTVFMGKLKGTNWGAGHADEAYSTCFPADVVFTDLGILVVIKGHALEWNEAAVLQTAMRTETGALAREQIQQAYESILYDDVKDVRITGGGPLGRRVEKRAGKPASKVFITRRTRIGLPAVAVDFDCWLSTDEVRAFFERTPLASKIKGGE